jgi:hypothetical protein
VNLYFTSKHGLINKFRKESLACLDNNLFLCPYKNKA